MIPRTFFAFSALTLLPGCVNLYAGISQAEVKPFYDQDMKQMVCCQATFTSGKNAGSIIAHIVKNGGDFTVDLNEQQVNSSASIAAADSSVSAVAKAVSDTAVTVQQISKEIP